MGGSIRHATLRNYVNAVCRLHKSRELPSPYGAQTDYISIVLKAVKKYESVANRREMIHDEMIHYMERVRPSLRIDSSDAAIIDWIFLGRFTGYRGIEWCQETLKDFEKIEDKLWSGPLSYAFIEEDFQFFTDEKVHIPNHTITADSYPSIGYVMIRYKKQKNDRNMEVIPYMKDADNPAFCPVRAAHRIFLRARRLGAPQDEPIAVFLKSEGQYAGERCFITKDLVADFLRRVAQKVYNMKDSDPALQRWSTHSIRVTACNLLHRQGFSDTYIQTRLRWSSNTFLMYLRNTLYSASQHTKALHISANNLPRITTVYDEVRMPTGDVCLVNSSSAASALPRHRGLEELEQVLHARAA